MRKILTAVLTLGLGMGVYAQSQLENPGFESWEDVNLPEEEPVDWSSIKTSPSSILNNSAPIIWWKSTDAHTGNYSVKLKNIYVALIGTVATGTITNGRVHSSLDPDEQYIYTDVADNRWHATFTTRPDSVVGWYKFYPRENDSAQIKVLLHRGATQIPEEGIPENWVGMAFFRSDPDTADEWTRFSVPFEYYNEDDPEYALAIISSGNGYYPKEESILYIDDIEMIHNIPVGITENEMEPIEIFIDRTGNLRLKGAALTDFDMIRIFDMAGRAVWSSGTVSETLNLTAANLKCGIYLISLENSKQRFVQKVFVE